MVNGSNVTVRCVMLSGSFGVVVARLVLFSLFTCYLWVSSCTHLSNWFLTRWKLKVLLTDDGNTY